MVPGKIYHVYNRANGWENLFSEWRNYIFFLRRFSVYVWPVAHLYAYSLVPNHFHLVVRIRDEAVLSDYFELNNRKKEESSKFLSRKVSKAFSNLFSSYAQAYNKVYDRMGSLFMQNMRVEEIADEEALCKVIHYIHATGQRHGLVKKMEDWQHSSYAALLWEGPTMLSGDFILNIFGGRSSFIQYHRQPVDPEYKWLDEKRPGSRKNKKRKRKD